MNLGTAQVIRANSRNLPLADNSVDLVVTSPPYFALRSYQDGGEHYAGQIGDEPTPAEFVASLLEVTRECVRVLKPSGSLWVNLGDKYAASATMQTKHGLGGSSLSSGVYMPDALEQPFKSRRLDNGQVRQKSLIGIPWRYALACIDDLGLILRAEVIWSKPNGLPESVTDRVRRSHETWFHFTLEPRYFSAVDEIREAHVEAQRRGVLTWDERRGRADQAARYSDQNGHGGTAGMAQSALGKLPGSVWIVPTEPLRVPDHLGIDHFAAFPTEWPRRIIQGWSPAGVCVECGEGRRPVTTRERMTGDGNRCGCGVIHGTYGATTQSAGQQSWGRDGRAFCSSFTLTGYACARPPCGHTDHGIEGGWLNPATGRWQECIASTRPAVVLDPFGGTGTTAMVAKALGRHGISVDMSADYCRLAEWRTNDRNQLAKVLGVAKVDAPDDHQLDLFGEATA